MSQPNPDRRDPVSLACPSVQERSPSAGGWRVPLRTRSCTWSRNARVRSTDPGRGGSFHWTNRSLRTWSIRARHSAGKRLCCPLECALFGGDLAVFERVEHPAAGLDRVPLRPRDLERRPSHEVVEEVLDLRPHLRPQDGGRNLTSKLTRINSRKNQWPFGENPADILGVAVGGPLHLASTPVDVQPTATERGQRLKIRSWSIGAFKVVRPVARPGRYLLVQPPKPTLAAIADAGGSYDEEVAVTRRIAATERE